ncbi:MAG: glutathione S-transferase family protein [Gammaproteobacteria bacterium]
MNEIILHHYELSPFSEKIRRILAYKRVDWRAVEQPVMAPKPALTPLTGGYRRIPVMQIGADVYCDTALIARRIEALHPEPVTVPAAHAGAIAVIEDWADHRLFMQAVPPVVVDLLDVLPAGFLEDRQQMTPGFSREALVAAAPHALAQATHALDYLDVQLAASGWLLGDHFTLADAACYHPVRFLQNSPELAKLVDARAALAAWAARIAGFGAGAVTPLAAADALAVARAAEPADVHGGSVAASGFGVGDTVDIQADDYGQEITSGRILRLTANEIVVLRDDPDVGAIAVHYPRAGYRVRTH